MRNRIVILAVLFFVILLGLASRQYSWLFPQVLGKYPGDALWSMAVYLAIAFVWPKTSSVTLLISSLGISYCVELSQLYQAQGINDIRESTIGHLLLGSTFNYLDLLAYTFGVMIIFAFETYFKSKER